MSSKKNSILPVVLDATLPPASPPRDIRDLFSYRLALLTRINDRDAQNMMIKQYGITLGEWRTLAIIFYLKSTSLRALARQAFMDEGQVSRSVTALIDRGLVSRQPGTEDRRSIILSLTHEGLALHDKVMGFARQMNEEILGAFSAQEQDLLLGLLDKLLTTVHQEFIRNETAG